MSSFRPTRASPPSKLTNLAESLLQSTLSTDLSRSSAVSIRELTGLSPEDVDLLDAIIARAGPSATTFPVVFSAHNDVLKERGLDPSELVFYGKLLKLGTLKGKNWGEKWDMVKLQQGYAATSTVSRTRARSNDQPRPPKGGPTRPHPRVIYPLKASRHTDSFTLHSHENESAVIDSEEEQVDTDVPQYHLHTRPVAPASPGTSETSSLSLGPRNYPLLAPPARSHPLPLFRPQVWGTETSDATEDAGAPSTTPPSYRAAVRESPPAKNEIVGHRAQHPTVRPLSSVSLTKARQLVAQARERKGSVTNEDDAWNKIKMLQDEKRADMFRQDVLLERCWHVWKEGYEWIITTNEQIGEARDNLILRLSIQRWRTLTSLSSMLASRAARVADTRQLLSAFQVWRAKAKDRRQMRWRASMRSKMKEIRDKRDFKLKEDVLEKWRQSYRMHLSDRHYTGSLILRVYVQWKRRLARLDHLDDVADEFAQNREGGALERCYYYWKHQAQLRFAHSVISESVGLRVKTEVLDVWRKQMHCRRDNRIADAYCSFMLKKRMIRSWKAARDRLQDMERLATEQASSRNPPLLRAAYLVLRARYQARYQGRRLQKIMALRRLKDAWTVWKRRMRQQRDREDAAIIFSLRINSPLAIESLEKWYKVHSSHQNSQSFAAFRYSDTLRRRILLLWRIRLRNRHKIMRQARMVDKFLVTRRVWELMRTKFAERRREHNLKVLELRRAQKFFYAWMGRANRLKALRLAETEIQDRVSKRILCSALTRWTNRTIDMKDRELEVTVNRDEWLTRVAFKKWRGARVRHVEEVSLMESYQFVKREENTRKIFYRWLSAARASRHRRLTLERQEAKIKFGLTSVAWDTWRERFKDKRLQPVECDFLLQSAKNTLFRAFAIWHSKTKSVPAIRFNASRIKAKCWNVWRPHALRTKAAREADSKTTLSKYLEKWLQAHRTKIALKAIARARYLRLPSAPIRPVNTTSRPNPTTAPFVSRNAFPRRTVRTEERSDVEDLEPGPSRRGPRLAGPRSVRSETSPPRRPPSRFSVPVTRDSSPARSAVGGRWGRDANPPALPLKPASSTGGREVGRGGLLEEFRQLQRRSKTPSEHSRAREPP
ncbi:hypothetical protein C8J57DRAFT_1446668 [Mycena rebaudengoi]|nr:hypothetical protein C8J57DRAFT_1446668 [Mycena rebaudengoi]